MKKQNLACLLSLFLLSLSCTSPRISLADTVTGPDSTRPPYVEPTESEVNTYSILSGGNTVNGYRLVGIPDGLGVLDNGDQTFSVFMHHELPETNGIARDHGGIGAFISEWVITRPGHPDGDFKVLSGDDLIKTVKVWNPGTRTYANSTAETFNRFCSADLPGAGAFSLLGRHGFGFPLWSEFDRFFKPGRQFGTPERIFMSGEETDGTFGGAYGRAFGTIVTGPNKGTTYELPLLGDLSFENIVASPLPQKDTVVGITDDAASSTIDSLGEVYFYIGEKTDFGDEITRAGLTNGKLYAVAVEGLPVENAAAGLGTGAGSTARFRLERLGDYSDDNGTKLYNDTKANNKLGISKFLRPEDGAWDPMNPAVFYFVTTGANYDADGDGVRETTGPGRLWRLTFKDILNARNGGTIQLMMDGTEGVATPDNITVNKKGHVYIQEDPGNNVRLAKLWRYEPETDTLTQVAQHSAAYFTAGGASFLTSDEESSGIIDLANILGPGWFLFDVQSHIALNGPSNAANRAKFGYSQAEGDELVQDGQLLAMFVPYEA